MTDASQKIDDYISAQPAWQQANLTRFRMLVHSVSADITEDWKWNVPFFLLNGRMLFAMSAFKAHTKYNFLTGPSLADPDTLFNNGLESKGARSIDIKENDEIGQDALRALVQAAVGAA